MVAARHGGFEYEVRVDVDLYQAMSAAGKLGLRALPQAGNSPTAAHKSPAPQRRPIVSRCAAGNLIGRSHTSPTRPTTLR